MARAGSDEERDIGVLFTQFGIVDANRSVEVAFRKIERAQAAEVGLDGCGAIVGEQAPGRPQARNAWNDAASLEGMERTAQLDGIDTGIAGEVYGLDPHVLVLWRRFVQLGAGRFDD